MASKLTKFDLQNVTDYVGFESFCHDLMSRQDYKDIEPLGGTKDKGRDALHVNKTTSEVTIFAYSVREDWEKKLFEDLKKICLNKHICNKVVFVTTGNITATEMDKIKEVVRQKYNWTLDTYDLERIATLVDNHYRDLKKLHPNIFVFSSQITEFDQQSEVVDKKTYAGYLLKANEERLEKYTPLLAEHREIEPFVVLSGSTSTTQQEVPVTQIPETAQIAIVLGESGAGKTTALWRIIVENSKNIFEDKPAKLPILINMRGWSTQNRCRVLAQQEFNLIGAAESSVEDELHNGNCLILIDGLNELPPNEDSRTEAYKDIQNFLINYLKNCFVICCRTSDYDPRSLDLEQLEPKLPHPKTFEVKRLDRAQISEYILKYFRETPDDAAKLMSELRFNDDTIWSCNTSILHLARIPLYLQLIIFEFQRNKQLPKNRAQLLSTFIQHIIQREKVRYTTSVDKYAKEKLLGSLAYRALQEGYLLRVPEQRAQSIIRDEIQNLKQQSLIQPSLTLGGVWQEILSNNFLHVAGWQWVEWLHQLILDYFLACKIVDIRTNGTQSEISELSKLVREQTWEQPCVIAMGLLDPLNGGKFLLDLVDANQQTAQLAYENQDDTKCEQIASFLVLEVTNNKLTTTNLSRVTITLPYYPIVQNFHKCFRSIDDATRIKIAEAISSMVIRYYPLTFIYDDTQITLSRYRSEKFAIQIFDLTRIKTAVERGLELLTTWAGNNNDEVRFFSAKGLWETDRGRTAEILKNLMLSGDEQLRNKIKDLMNRWGIR